MFRIMCLMIVSAVAVGSLLCGKASAEEHKHDGFFLRLAPGIGVAVTSENIGNNKLQMSGSSGIFNIAIGGAVAENVILHLDLSGVTVTDPKVKFNGQTQTTATSEAATSLTGVGLTYYFPSNMYLTGAVGMAKSTNKAFGKEYSTDRGYGVNLMLGKEWWVSDNWGLGVAGQFLYAVCPDKPVAGVTPDVKTTAFGVLFSATYN